MFINETESFGQIITAGTTGLTGSVVATMVLILVVLFVISLILKVDFELFGIIILPFTIAVAAYYSVFMTPLIFILLYFSMILMKNWIFK